MGQFSVEIREATGSILSGNQQFVIFGVLAQIPIGDMFMAGILPGLILFLSFALVITLIGFAHGFPKGEWFTRSEAISALLYSLPATLIPIAIIGGILFGIATPTESAAVASLIAFLVGWLIYGELKPAALFGLFRRTAINASMVIFMIAAASVFGWVIIYEALPQKLAAFITSVTSDPFLFLLIVNLILLVVGMLLDGIAAVILITPILLPIAMNDYDISAYQFGVVMCLNLALGLLTPPVGVGLYIASSMSGVSPGRILKSLWPFLLAVSAVLILLSLFPVISLALV
ncbi:TRAP transporter, DctM subunit [Paracoccus halophilus]|uniref:TRAP transporter, DctM subunit n=1 Tax=Paracoccus halophilus TaxID=376733 RepID=A0A1I0UBS0_9RHOB|nr:TRAP transporter, DctM subunit [Paracoccus halophilus]